MKEDKFEIFLIYVGIVVMGISFLVFKDSQSTGSAIFLFITAIAFLILLFRYPKSKKKIEETAKKAEENRINNLIKKGKWEFPCEEFYNKCTQIDNIVFDNEFAVKKAQQIVVEILVANNVAEENYNLFTDKKKIKEFLKKGKECKEKTEKLKKENEIQKILEQKEIREVKPNEENAKIIKHYTEIASLRGTQKREKMLLFDYEKNKINLEELKKKKASIDKYGEHLYWKSQHNDVDWALLGGIAEGIAGPAAGVAVALDTMSQNAKKEEENRMLRYSAVEVTLSGTEIEYDIERTEKRLDKMKENIETSKRKVVLSKPEGKEIAKYISIEKTNFDRIDDGVLKITANVFLKNPLDLDVPKSTKMVVDGTISGKVFYEGNFVDNVKLVLSIYGITNASKQVATITGYCTKSAEYPGEYTLEITDMTNLWVMEY